jgi:pyruvate formate lyase activating enzyme
MLGSVRAVCPNDKSQVGKRTQSLQVHPHAATVAVSAGYISPEPRMEFFRHMDAANIDLKGFTEGFYKNLCSGKLAPVLETLEYLKQETNVWFEITTLLIPCENDSAAEIEAESAWVMDRLGPDVPLHFTAFHPDWKLMDATPTPAQTLRAARGIAKDAGIRHVYTGNVHDPAGQSTYCHSCGAVVIGRDQYDVTTWNFSAEGMCAECGTRCHGTFEAAPGRWGQRRQPVRLRTSEPETSAAS